MYRENVRVGGRPEIFQLGLHGAGPDNFTVKWFFDGHGKILARTDAEFDEYAGKPIWHETLKAWDEGRLNPISKFDLTVDEGDGLGALSEDGQAIIRVSENHKGTYAATRVDLGTGSETSLFHDPVHDVDAILKNQWTGRANGFSVDEDLPSYHYFDPKREALQKGFEQAFPGLSVHAVSADLAEDKFIVMTDGPRTPTSFYLFNRITHQATAIAASYPDLDPSNLAHVIPYPYKARDETPIAAYLTLPPGRPAKNLPFVVLPHGGPDDRDDMSFDWLSQFLASRGYAVLKPNFRGSSGYGRAFTEAGMHQWGLKMQDDISDGVKKAIADGIADPKRVCIVGASYGGYAALAGATLTPELYACSVSYAGVSNLPDMLGYSKLQFGTDISNGSFWTTRIGDAFDDAVQLKATSPALHADRVAAPILLLHSELDVTVPIYQSEMMDIALRNAGKKVQFVRIPGDDHYLSLEQTRVRFLREIEKFLAANIGN